VSLEKLTLVFLRQRERLRYRETLRSLNAFRSSPKPSLGNFLRAYWYLWAASFIFPFWRTHGGQTCSEEEDRTRRKRERECVCVCVLLSSSNLPFSSITHTTHTHPTPDTFVLLCHKLKILTVRHRSWVLC